MGVGGMLERAGHRHRSHPPHVGERLAGCEKTHNGNNSSLKGKTEELKTSNQESTTEHPWKATLGRQGAQEVRIENRRPVIRAELLKSAVAQIDDYVRSERSTPLELSGSLSANKFKINFKLSAAFNDVPKLFKT